MNLSKALKVLAVINIILGLANLATGGPTSSILGPIIVGLCAWYVAGREGLK